MEKFHGFACMVCGGTLVYDDKAKEQICDYCGQKTKSTIYCPEGHFVCDVCHSGDAIELLNRMADSNDRINPIDIVEDAYLHHAFKFHGPEHHSLVPAAILISLKNIAAQRPNGDIVTAEMVREGIRRGTKIPGGFCGTAGNCGACVGAGVAIAVFLGSTPTRGPERKASILTTIAALERVTDGLIRCCKRSTFHGIAAAMQVLREKFKIDLGPEPRASSCKNSHLNKDCAKEECVFYPGLQDAN